MATPKTVGRWPCIFRESFVRLEIDPRLQEHWREAYGQGAPFGRLRKLWRDFHCAELNPYGSETCPYPKEACGDAFARAVESTLQVASAAGAGGYFRRVAHSTAQVRADYKPLARDAQGPRQPADLPDGDRTGQPDLRERRHPEWLGEEPYPDSGISLHRVGDRPVLVRDLLRSLDVGPREGRAPDGQEGRK